MSEGALIFFLGLSIGFFLANKPIKEISNELKKSLNIKQKGIIVDLNPLPEIGDPINEETN